jgi:hypothetical protein
MSSERKLADIASNLDDISETLDEIKNSVEEGDCKAPLKPLDEIQRKVDRASHAIDEAVESE